MIDSNPKWPFFVQKWTQTRDAQEYFHPSCKPCMSRGPSTQVGRPWPEIHHEKLQRTPSGSQPRMATRGCQAQSSDPMVKKLYTPWYNDKTPFSLGEPPPGAAKRPRVGASKLPKEPPVFGSYLLKIFVGTSFFLCLVTINKLGTF